MLWKTHIRISIEVLRRLGVFLPPDVFDSFKNGIIAPDKWRDFPHHYGKSEQIKANLLKARKYYLINDQRNAYFHLGVAFHYIQDSYTSMASFYPRHHSWEESIEDCGYVSNVEETIQYWLRDNYSERNRCLKLANELSREVQGRDLTLYIATMSGHEALKSFAEPIIDLNLALKASLLVAKSTLSSPSDLRLDIALSRSLDYHQALLQRTEESIADQIISLANQIEDFKGKKKWEEGVVPRIRNMILTLRVKTKELQLNSKYRGYDKKKHLLKVNAEYRKAVELLTLPHIGWHDFYVPQLNLSLVNRVLVPIREENCERTGRTKKYSIMKQEIVDRR
jgi:hypothetical protein